MMEGNNVTFNVYGGQVNRASENATISATQNNGVKADELEGIIKGIMENLSGLKQEETESIRDIVDMAKEELAKQEPKASRLRSCVTLLAPMFTIANGIPTLVNNLQRLVDYITPYIG